MQETAHRPLVTDSGDGDVRLLAGARALTVEGDLTAARVWFEEAYQAAESIGDLRTMAAAALGSGGLWVHEHRSVTVAMIVEQRMRHALSLVDAGSPAALRLRVRLAGEASYRSGDPAGVLAELDEARRAGDPVGLAEALSIAHHCLLGPGHGAQRRELAEELIRVSSATNRRRDRLMGLLWWTIDLFLDGDPHAERRLAELRADLARVSHLAIGFVVTAMEVMLSIAAGDLDVAETSAAACFDLGSQAGDVDATGWYAGQLVTIRWYQGRLGELLPMLTELVSSSTLSEIDHATLAALAVAAAQAGDWLRAAGALATLCGRDLGDLPRSSSWLVTMNGIVEAANLLDDAQISARAYELLLPFADLPMIVSLGAASLGSVQHALGVASLTAGEIDRAAGHLRAAIQTNLALGHWPAVLASRHRYEQALALSASEPAIPAICNRHGHVWTVKHGRRRALVRHGVGMLHLAVLLANPETEITATELAAGSDALAGRVDVSTQPVLDRTAVQEYLARLACLREMIEAEPCASGGAARREYDWLLSDLAASTGLGGRVRPFTDDRERARLAVGRAIRRAIDRIEAVDPLIGQHLRDTIRTGGSCSYRPSSAPRPADPGFWNLGLVTGKVADVNPALRPR